MNSNEGDHPVISSDNLTADERAAMRAFLQRCDVRLSTVHRVATALLSGAGLMVLLPAIARDSVVTIMRALLVGGPEATRLLLLAAMGAVLSLPFMALWFLLRDLTRFYFHAQHLLHDGRDVFAPRFTLTGLRLPLGELNESIGLLEAARTDPTNIELLVPPRAASRATIDRQLDAYGGLGRTATEGINETGQASQRSGDIERAAGLFELVASRSRTLPDEVAKVEHGMVRHMLRIQVIVLRYVKALLAFLTTALAVFAADSVVESHPGLDPSARAALGCVILGWAPCIVVAVNAPVRWIEQLLRNEGAAGHAVRTDDEFTRVERIATAIATVGWVLAATAVIVLLVGSRQPSTALKSISGVALATTAAAMTALLVAAQRRSHKSSFLRP